MTEKEKPTVEKEEYQMFNYVVVTKEQKAKDIAKMKQEQEEKTMEQDAKEAEKIMSQRATPERLARVIELTNKYKNTNTNQNPPEKVWHHQDPNIYNDK